MRKSGCFPSNGVLTGSERDPVCAGGSCCNRYDACRVKIGDDDTGTRQYVICLVNRLAGDNAREFLTMHVVTVQKTEQNRREGCSLNGPSNPLRHSLHLLGGVAFANGMLRRASEWDSARKRRLTTRVATGILFPMRALLFAFVLAFAITWPMQPVFAQGAEPGDPMRIVVLVDNSQIPIVDPLPFIRRGLQEFLNGLPPNHELMLVTTGAQMNIRVEPTRDYLTVMQSALSIQVMRNSGNALISSVEEVYARYLRSVERRFPVLVIVATEGRDMSPRITNQSVNALLRQLTNSGVRVNAVLLSPTGYTPDAGSLVASFTLEMTKRTGGAFEPASAVTAPAKLKTLAGRIGQQYKAALPRESPGRGVPPIIEKKKGRAAQAPPFNKRELILLKYAAEF